MPDLSDLPAFLNVWGPSIFGGAVALTGVGLLAYTQWMMSKVGNWVTTNAVVRQAELVLNRMQGEVNGGVYSPRVRYEFTVNGVKYEGTRLAPTGDVSTSIKSDMEAKISDLEVGGIVPVYYDPNDPRRCALTLQPDGMMFSGILIAGGIGLAVLAWVLREAGVIGGS